MKKREFFEKSWLVICIIALPVVVCASGDLARADKPNFVILLGDDCSWYDLGYYGGQAKTPNIDRMAEEGMRFDQAIGTTAMCTPTRHSLYTGIYPIKRGGYKNHSAVKKGTKSVCHYLGALGYRVGLSGKGHIKPRDSFPFERVEGFPRNCVMSKTPVHNLEGVGEFMTRKKAEPFCLFIASVHPHGPWTEGDRGLYPAETLKLPPHWVDTPEQRMAYRNYLAEISELDKQVGDIMRLLGEEKLEEKTLFIFASEQGGQFPGSKWTLWDAGIRFGLIARWPGRIKAGTRTQALLQYEDILPTLIDLAGGERPGGIDGRSFVEVLWGKRDKHRDYAFGVHTNTPEGPPYPIRCIRDQRYKLIVNLLPENTYKEKHLTEQDKYTYWKSWVAKAAGGDKYADWAVKRFQHRPAVEFYDLKKDPYEVNNLADEVAYAGVIKKMRTELEGWMKLQGDTGADTDK
ncbi:MAG: sulfatase family protein [Planctomycetota bacterium]|jgi:arylsulfatase A-like enzyme